MKKYYLLSPEVAGQLGENTVFDYSTTPAIVKKLHYEFDGWLGDDLLESTPCFICSDQLSEILKKYNLKGYLLDTCEISKSDLFSDIYPERELPIFYWLKIVGENGDDFKLSSNNSLLVSEEALNVLRKVNIKYCEIEEYSDR